MAEEELEGLNKEPSVSNCLWSLVWYGHSPDKAEVGSNVQFEQIVFVKHQYGYTTHLMLLDLLSQEVIVVVEIGECSHVVLNG